MSATVKLTRPIFRQRCRVLSNTESEYFVRNTSSLVELQAPAVDAAQQSFFSESS